MVLLNDKYEQVDRIDYTSQDVKRANQTFGTGMPIFFITYRTQI